MEMSDYSLEAFSELREVPDDLDPATREKLFRHNTGNSRVPVGRV